MSSRRPRIAFTALLLLLVIAALAACSADARVQRASDGRITLTLTAEDVNEIISSALSINQNILNDVSATLADDQITLSGEYQFVDGRAPANGSITLTPTISEGHLFFTVADVAIPGVIPEDVRLAAVREWLAVRLTQRARRESRANLESIEITPNTLQLVILSEPAPRR